MTNKEIKDICRENYRKNGSIAYLIFFFLALLAGSIMAAGSLFVDLLILIVPFIALPILFSAYTSILLLREQKLLTFTGFLNCFTSYFKEKFRSTFQVIRSALFTLLVYIVISLIFSLSVNLSLYYNNWNNYADVIQEIAAVITKSEEAVKAIIKEHQQLFDTVAIITFVPTLFIGSIAFIYLIDHHSISLFHRLQTPQMPGKVNLMIQRSVVRDNKSEFYKLYIKLNWPFYLLFTLVFAGTTVGAYFIKANYHFMYVFALTISLFVTFGLLGPSHLAANETIYIALKDKYNQTSTQLLDSVISDLENYINQYKSIEETKKDSDESQ